MKFLSAIVPLAVLTAAGVWAQSADPVTLPQPPGLSAPAVAQPPARGSGLFDDGAAGAGADAFDDGTAPSIPGLGDGPSIPTTLTYKLVQVRGDQCIYELQATPGVRAALGGRVPLRLRTADGSAPGFGADVGSGRADGVRGRRTHSGGGRRADGVGGGRAGSPAPHSVTVRRGDSMSSIARRHGTTVDAIRRANPAAPVDGLRVGQQLTVPGPRGAHAGGRRTGRYADATAAPLADDAPRPPGGPGAGRAPAGNPFGPSGRGGPPRPDAPGLAPSPRASGGGVGSDYAPGAGMNADPYRAPGPRETPDELRDALRDLLNEVRSLRQEVQSLKGQVRGRTKAMSR